MGSTHVPLARVGKRGSEGGQVCLTHMSGAFRSLPAAPASKPCGPIDREALGKDPHDLRLEGFIALGTGRQPRGIPSLGNMLMIGGWGDWQDPADRLDPIMPTMLVDKGDHRFSGLSSSPQAKYAEALRRISLACRSSRFSRSRALSFSATSLGTPARRPPSTFWEPKPRQPSATDTPRHASAPSAPLGSAPQGKACSLSCLSCSILLRSWSLRQYRRGSEYLLWEVPADNNWLHVEAPAERVVERDQLASVIRRC